MFLKNSFKLLFDRQSFRFEAFISVFTKPWVSLAPHMDKGGWISMFYRENTHTHTHLPFVRQYILSALFFTTVNSKHQPIDG